MKLTQQQQEQVDHQLIAHQHDDYETDIVLTEGHVLSDFLVKKNVWRPDITSALYFSRFLFFNNGLYQGKTAIGIGSGSGIQSVILGRYANRVVVSDISPLAVENTKENIKKFGLENKVEVVQGDLLENVNLKADFIAFNHPFFPQDPNLNDPISRSMLGGTELIHRFLKDARAYLLPEGLIAMPYLHLSGEQNNPEMQGLKHGYKVKEQFKIDIGFGIQRGEFSVYVLQGE